MIKRMDLGDVLHTREHIEIMVLKFNEIIDYLNEKEKDVKCDPTEKSLDEKIQDAIRRDNEQAIIDKYTEILKQRPEKTRVIMDHTKQLLTKRWISVDTALPSNEEQVLVFGKVTPGETPFAIDEIYNGQWVYWGVQHSASRGHVITHWMPLPEPPG